MKAPHISGDLAVKLGLGVVGLGVAWYVLHKLKSAAIAAAPLLNPTDPRNLAYSSVNAAGAALVTAPDGAGKNADGSWTLGGFLYDVTHPNTSQQIKDMATGSPPPAVQYGAPATPMYDAMGNVITG